MFAVNAPTERRNTMAIVRVPKVNNYTVMAK